MRQQRVHDTLSLFLLLTAVESGDCLGEFVSWIGLLGLRIWVHDFFFGYTIKLFF